MDQTRYNLLGDLNVPAEEAYKTLRTNIRFCDVINKIKTITVTSCIPGEGKTTTVLNLAISMAKTGMKTLVADVDLRRPMTTKIMGINSRLGITSYLTGDAEIDDIVHSTVIENLYLIPSGPIPPNPAELLSSEKFAEFTKDIKERDFECINGKFDIIIFDTPPLGSVIDGAILASQTDGTILVIKSKSVNYKLAQNVKEQLEKANATILGVVLNNVNTKDYRYQYGYGGKYKYYYYGRGSTSKENTEKEGIFGKVFNKLKLKNAKY
ncbi:MAG TPA: CpsD/CapB family tyrosine-protein kinase [Clostridiaceae bacterium]|nr:CpsD/CapB family tyrosine-protein kinase [Clostridiaceae bacterium]